MKVALAKSAVFILLICAIIAIISFIFGDEVLYPQTLEKLYFYSGFGSYLALLLSLFVWKKYLGFCALALALSHIWIFAYIDFGLDISLLLSQMREKIYLYFGLLSAILMLLCAVASFLRRFPYAILVYVAIIAALVHIMLIQKVLSLNDYALIAISCIMLIVKISLKIKAIYVKNLE